MIFRFSGTEPKLKIYLSAVGETEEESNRRFHTLKTEINRVTSKMMASLTESDSFSKNRMKGE